jgi:hypothetical protein
MSMIARRPNAVEVTGYHVLARPPAAVRPAPLRLVVNRPCVAGPGAVCSVCDAAMGEPCRRQSIAP